MLATEIRSAREIARAIARGELSSVEITAAHVRRVEETHAALRAVATPLYERAMRAAEAADAAVRRGGSLGPLHGVPVTVKEFFDVEATPTTAGLENRRQHRAERDAPVVARLRAAGAVVLAKTNAAQLGLMLDTMNPLFGRARNPWDPERGPGGSSGGEAALIAAGGSPLGLGSDGGGSIRQPCHATGIHGLKPTAGRLAGAGHWTLPNFGRDWVQPGPMARHVEDLALALRVLASGVGAGESGVPPPGDPALVRIAGLRIGVIEESCSVSPAPAVRRAVREAADALRELGATLEPFELPEAEAGWSLYLALLYADGLRALRRAARGSALEEGIRQMLRFTRLPGFVRPVLARVLEAGGQPQLAGVLRAVRKPVLSPGETSELLGRQAAMRARFGATLDARGLDALLGPPSPVPALRHGEFYATATLHYTALYNLLGAPAGVVSLTRVRPGEESDRPASRDLVERALARNEAGSAGLPIGVQVAARWGREDVVLAVMGALESAFRGRADYPALAGAPRATSC
jgi:fatty acid amide hydrolase